MVKQKYALVHSHRQGSTLFIFEYRPSEEKPYPDLRKVVDSLEIEYEPDKGESLDMTLVDDTAVEMTFGPESGSSSMIDYICGHPLGPAENID